MSEVLTYTAACRMRYFAILRRAVPWYEEVAKLYGVSSDDCRAAFRDYAMLSVRITSNGKMPFQLATALDGSDALRKKFCAYLDLDNPDIIWQLEADIREFDKPADEDKAPEPPDTKDPED